MKARDYYEVLKREEEKSGFERAVERVVIMMSEECGRLVRSRGVKIESGIRAVINEMNDRWNAMRRWDDRLRRDGFKMFWEVRIEEMRQKKEEEVRKDEKE